MSSSDWIIIPTIGENNPAMFQITNQIYNPLIFTSDIIYIYIYTTRLNDDDYIYINPPWLAPPIHQVFLGQPATPLSSLHRGRGALGSPRMTAWRIIQRTGYPLIIKKNG